MFTTLLHSKRLYLCREVQHRQHQTHLSPHFEQNLDSKNWNTPGVPRLLPVANVVCEVTLYRKWLYQPQQVTCISAPQMCCSVTDWLHVFYQTERRQWSCLSLDQHYQRLVTSKYKLNTCMCYWPISEQTSFHSDMSHCVSRNVTRL